MLKWTLLVVNHHTFIVFYDGGGVRSLHKRIQKQRKRVSYKAAKADRQFYWEMRELRNAAALHAAANSSQTV